MNKNCFICGHNESVKKGFVAIAYKLMECRKCGLQFLDPAPDEKRLNAIYADYYKAWDLDKSANEVSTMKAKTFKSYLDTKAQVVPAGRLLDIGCATGELLEVARNSGFDVYGIEVSAQGIARCRQKFGKDKIREGSLKPGDFPSDFFDVVTLFDVIEHIHSPSGFLETVRDALKPSGVLMIATPDTSSWTNKMFGEKWPHYKEEHIYYYNRANIAKMLSSLFDVLEIRRAKKTLSINYINSVTQAYPNKGFLSSVINLMAKLPDRIRLAHFKVHIGEMLVLCCKRKR